MKRILIVEDESSISDFVKGELEYEGYEVCIKEDGREGLEEALNNEYDLVILDIMLPSMNGFEICRRIKRVKATPVIMLSAKSSVIDKVNGLKLGADDYISKPFAIEELLARIEVVFRRVSNPKDSIFKFKDITIRRLKRGECYHMPYFGCREFPAHFALYEGEEIHTAYENEEEKDLGLMLFDMDYSDPENIEPMFFRAVMRKGVIDLRNCEVIR